MAEKFAKVHIEILNICNLQCSFCPEVVRAKKLMDLDLFRRVVAQVAPITEQIAFHLMGDPLVHPRLKEMIEICGEYGARIFFVTNGVLLKDEKVEWLLHPAFRQVNFSLHSFHDNFPQKDPTAYLEKIFRYSERAMAVRPDLYINYRLWNLQGPQGAHPANLALLRAVGERFDFEIPTEWDVRRRKSFRLRGRVYLHFDTEFVWPDLHLPERGRYGTCKALRHHFGILVDGTVVPCCLDKEGAIPLGRLDELPLSDILDGPRARRMLLGFDKRQLHEELCRRCQYIERFGT